MKLTNHKKLVHWEEKQESALAGAGYSCSLKQCPECHVILFPPSSETVLMIINANKVIYVYWVEK
jgi:hypothetical protein